MLSTESTASGPLSASASASAALLSGRFPAGAEPEGEPGQRPVLSPEAARLPRILLLVLCLAYLAGAAYGWGGQRLADVMGDFGLSGAALTASASCLAYAVRARGRHRSAWACFGVSSFMVATGNGIWGWYECVVHQDLPSPSLADYVFLFYAPPAILGLLLLANRPRNAAGWLCLALDGWLIAGSLLTLSWSLALARTAQGDAHSPLRLTVQLAYPLLDILLISMVLGLRYRSRDGNRAAVHTAIVALALTVLCDALFTTQTFRAGYHSGELLDAGWFSGSMLLAWAPWAGTSPLRGGSGGGRHHVASTFSALTPYAAAAVCTVGMLYDALSAHRLDKIVLITSCTVVLALILRQGVMLLDNLSLAQRLSQQENHFRTLVQGSSDVIMIADRGGTLRYVSPAAAGVYGRPAEDLVGRRLRELVHPDDVPQVLGEVQRYLDQGPDGETTARIECRVRSGAGEWLDVESTVNHHPHGLIFNSRDVSERVRLQAQLHHNAFHDALTDLPNRALFLERGRAALSRPGAGVAVLFLDLDGFKAVNDTAGHQVGDELLVQAARRLRDAVRSGDTVARLGGDEFAVLLVGEPPVELDQARAVDVAERLRRLLSAPYRAGGEEHTVAASVGIALADPGSTPGGALGAAELLRNADLAMYQAKRRGKDRVALFTPTLRQEQRRRTELDRQLADAVREGCLELVHEPIVDLAAGRVAAVEAQPRWRTARGGPLAAAAPAELLQAAAGDRSLRFARWLVEQAVRQAATRGRRLGPAGRLPVVVRLPARSVVAPGLTEAVAGALHRVGLPPDRLVLQITDGGSEEGRAHRFEELVRRAEQLRTLGIGLALDGLGGGSAPLAGLRQLPVTRLCLERDLVEGLSDSAFQRTLAGSVLTLGRQLGLAVHADGVDSPGQAALLLQLGCTEGQGALYGGPRSEKELAELLLGPAFEPRTGTRIPAPSGAPSGSG